MRARKIVKQRANGICEARIANVCQGRAVHIHHRQMKSQGGKDTPENLVALCDRCHMSIHNNPSWSYANGWLVHPWNRVA